MPSESPGPPLITVNVSNLAGETVAIFPDVDAVTTTVRALGQRIAATVFPHIGVLQLQLFCQCGDETREMRNCK